MEKLECQCEKCKSACEHNPGWFMPGEAEQAAQYLELSMSEFFKKYLGVNWWEADDKTDDDIFVLAPAITTMTPGEEYPGDPRGRCVFFEDGLCRIHAVKPYECAQYMHESDVSDRHWTVAQAWQDKQHEIEELLGRCPESSEYSGGLFSFLDW